MKGSRNVRRSNFLLPQFPDATLIGRRGGVASKQCKGVFLMLLAEGVTNCAGGSKGGLRSVEGGNPQE